jgi:rod shape determining protein RodA
VNTTPIQAPAEETKPSKLVTFLTLDPLLLVATLALCAASLYAIAGATREDVPGSPDYYVIRQGIAVGIGLVFMLVLSRIDYTRFRELKYGIYALLVGLILLGLAVGTAGRGAIGLGGVEFQPSELGKVLLILSLGGFIVTRLRTLQERQTTARLMLLALIPAAMTLALDLGTGMVFVVIAVAMLFVAGTPWRHFVALFALITVAVVSVLVVAPAIGVTVLKQYQMDRLTAFLHPDQNPGDEGYQQAQSRIAIGSGEKTGRGLEGATQTRLNFLPAHHTDFVFAVVGERFGFVGAATILMIYALLIWRALRIVTLSKNLYGAVVAGGVLGMLMFQVFINIGMTVGIMPITGVPLPLLSYGGTSVIATLIALGLLQSVYVQGRSAAAGKARVASIQGA